METTYLKIWYESIIEYLHELVNSATNTDKVRVRFANHLGGATNGPIVYFFKPSSALCYIAFNFVQQILKALADDPEVSSQQVIVTGQLADNELTIMINKEK
jgi:hypothetical protein